MLLTVITTTYNNLSAFKATYASVLSCFRKISFAFDYIIVDSSHTNCIRQHIKECSSTSNFSHDTKYTHVDPCGPYSAMNAGISLCSTKYIWILNAGDEIVSIPDDFSHILAQLSIPIHGTVRKTSVSSDLYGKSNYSSFYNFRLHELHPACIIPLSIYCQLGLYDPTISVAADLHFLLRVTRRYPFYFIPSLSVFYPSGGISSNHQENLFRILCILVSSRHLLVAPFFLFRYLYYLISCS